MKCEYLLEDGRTIGVEELALEFYAARGWKGFHSETSILSTLYGLLFWDIIYMDNIPGVFASEFQSRPELHGAPCPLDMRTEFFYESRREVIETRLAEIEHSAKQGDGRASDIETLIRRVDEREREKGTLCVGVTWKYGREDLIDIAEVGRAPLLGARRCGLAARKHSVFTIVYVPKGIGGPALAKICGLFARTYWAYSSGVPDLCLWKPETRELKIVEVKLTVLCQSVRQGPLLPAADGLDTPADGFRPFRGGVLRGGQQYPFKETAAEVNAAATRFILYPYSA
ncbi:MAG: hypothetical protein BJ554DRAFT_8298 [Olpidium bornovanus]|uniref:Fanconi-associated nuclease n=1 Tax=Olpidium bornovanus TaxID=278681 RepID=A0A8H7ZU95_9FUNG|nr:MAG: hypothetical protein BJ554DRAFT_8298 [Olpidium bornovanus]